MSENLKWIMGGLAAVGSFLLVQGDVEVAPIVKVAIGAFLVFAAYANPAAVGAKLSSLRG